MAKRGWCETTVPVTMLDELAVPYETMSSPFFQRTADVVPGGVIVYAPAWVAAIAMRLSRSNPRVRWDIVKTRLLATRDDNREQDLVLTELSLDLDAPEWMQDAANNFRRGK